MGEVHNTKNEFKFRLIRKMEARRKSIKLCFTITLAIVLLISVKLFSRLDESSISPIRRNLKTKDSELKFHIISTLQKLTPLRAQSKARNLSSGESTELRYVTFGTSVTYGSMMKNQSKAYPFQLSSNAVNLAMRASDSSYPSMCTQTMLHDSIYDVIIVEYDRRRFESLAVFAHRLRHRFPDATIVLTKMWNLMDVIVRPKGGGKVEKLREWLIKSGKPFMSQEALDFVLNSDVTLHFYDRLNERDKTMEKIAETTDSKIYSWDIQGDIKDLLRDRFPLFVDLVHPNDEGHSVIARDIQKIISETQPKHSDRVGTWGDGDFCSSWFQSGAIDINHHNSIALRSPSTPLTKFDEKNEKYALEFHKEEAAVQIENPFDGPRKIYLTYMASYPERLYPKVSVYIAGQPESSAVIIDPVAGYDFPVHVQDTKNIGVIGPGKNVIKFKTLEPDTEAPFRLVGFAITNGVFNPSDMYFKPTKIE